jgi:signal transduction histidine kinase
MCRNAPIPMIAADIALTERVLENLIENALTHTPSGGRIVVSLAAEGNSVAIEVTDTGKGIAPEHQERIFEPFRCAAQKLGSSQHAGLGLAIARRIVELHGAQLSVVSAVGAGSRFKFSLPAVA